jgi:predicted phage terminase large subunit-like protein
VAAPAWWDALQRSFDEALAAAENPPGPRWATPGQLAAAVDPTTVQTPALDLIDCALVDVEEGRCDRLIIQAPPQEGKSTRVTTIGPLWMLIRNPDRRIACVSYAMELAEDFGRTIRNHITNNSGDDGTLDLGLRIAPDNGSARRWQLDGHRGGVRSVGMAGGLTGRPADALFIDDPISNPTQADSATHREMVWRWWQQVGSTRLAPGAPVVLVLTRWHADDLAGRLLAAEDGHRWRVLNIPAQAESEDDPLGRAVGEYLISARKRTVPQWEQIKVATGSRGWNAMYQGRPSPASGDLLKREWWRYYDTPQAIERPDGSMWVPLSGRDEVCASWDMAFKDTASSDYVVGQVWLRRGVHAYLLDQVRARMSFTDTLAAVRSLAARWPQALAKYVEDKANGTAVINMLARSVPGLIPVEPEGGKVARVAAVSPFVEAGNVHLPDPALAPWVGELVEEAAAFPNGAHDDQCDALSQALNRLLLNPLLLGAGDEPDDALDDEIDAEMRISAY